MIAVCGPDDLIAELEPYKNQFHIISKDDAVENNDEVLLYLFEDGHKIKFRSEHIILINAVTETLSANNLPSNILRMNGWKSFISRTTWEIAGDINQNLSDTLKKIDKKILKVKDEPGFIAGRVLAMIINEAWFTKEENISTEKEIDIAMTLGTGYPYGPFEWTNIIGANYIVDLLHKLAVSDVRYMPCELLKKAVRS